MILSEWLERVDLLILSLRAFEVIMVQFYIGQHYVKVNTLFTVTLSAHPKGTEYFQEMIPLWV